MSVCFSSPPGAAFCQVCPLSPSFLSFVILYLSSKFLELWLYFVDFSVSFELHVCWLALLHSGFHSFLAFGNFYLIFVLVFSPAFPTFSSSELCLSILSMLPTGIFLSFYFPILWVLSLILVLFAYYFVVLISFSFC